MAGGPTLWPIGSTPYGETPNTPQSATPTQSVGFVSWGNGPGRVAKFKGIELWWRSYEVDHASAFAGHKYPGIPGQVIEPLGREPYTISMDTAWLGPEWRRRLDNFLAIVDGDQTSGELILPDGRAVNAFCSAAKEQHDDCDGCTLPLTFEEDQQVDAIVMPEENAVTAVSADLSDYQTESAAVKPYIDEYLALLTSPQRIASRELLEAYRRLDALLYAAQEACDLATQGGVGFNEALAMSRWHAQIAFPLPDLLG